MRRRMRRGRGERVVSPVASLHSPPSGGNFVLVVYFCHLFFPSTPLRLSSPFSFFLCFGFLTPFVFRLSTAVGCLSRGDSQRRRSSSPAVSADSVVEASSCANPFVNLTRKFPLPLSFCFFFLLPVRLGGFLPLGHLARIPL